MANDAVIGVFDSGVGGLSVLREIRAQLPNESLIYVADSAHVPYGEKSQDYIRARSFALAEFLLAQGAKALVVACNTATAAAVGELRSRYPLLPIVGMEPALKPAVQVSQSKVVGVLATTGTLKSAKFAALLERFAHDARIITQPCPGLVECIEQGDLTSSALADLLAGWVAPLLEQQCDTLILGCTHYPFIKPLLRTLVPETVAIIDTGAAVAKRLAQLLAERDALSTGVARAPIFYSSAHAERLTQVVSHLTEREATVKLLPLAYR